MPILVELEAAFGEQTVTEGTRAYTFKLRRCFLDLQLYRCQLAKSPTRYRHCLTNEDFQRVRKNISEGSNSVDGKVDGKAGFQLSDILAFVNASANASASANHRNSSDETISSTSRRQFYVVRELPSQRWRFGDNALRDPRTDGFLEGDYLAEPREINGELQTNVLCGLELEPSKEQIKAIIELKAHMGDFHVSSKPIDEEPGNDLPVSMNKQLIEKIAILKHNKLLQDKAGLGGANHELLLARCTLLGAIENTE